MLNFECSRLLHRSFLQEVEYQTKWDKKAAAALKKQAWSAYKAGVGTVGTPGVARFVCSALSPNGPAKTQERFSQLFTKAVLQPTDDAWETVVPDLAKKFAQGKTVSAQGIAECLEQLRGVPGRGLLQ